MNDRDLVVEWITAAILALAILSLGVILALVIPLPAHANKIVGSFNSDACIVAGPESGPVQLTCPPPVCNCPEMRLVCHWPLDGGVLLNSRCRSTTEDSRWRGKRVWKCRSVFMRREDQP